MRPYSPKTLPLPPLPHWWSSLQYMDTWGFSHMQPVVSPFSLRQFTMFMLSNSLGNSYNSLDFEFFIEHPKGWQVSHPMEALQPWDSRAGNRLKMGLSLLSDHMGTSIQGTWSPLQLLHHPHLWIPSTQSLLKVSFSSLVLWKQLDSQIF